MKAAKFALLALLVVGSAGAAGTSGSPGFKASKEFDTSAKGTLVPATWTAPFRFGSTVNDPDKRFPSKVSSRNCLSLSIDAIFSHLILKSESE